MATANDLLTRAIDETKHLNHNEIFLGEICLKAMNGTEYLVVIGYY